MTKKEIQNQLDEIYNHIFTNYEENFSLMSIIFYLVNVIDTDDL